MTPDLNSENDDRNDEIKESSDGNLESVVIDSDTSEEEPTNENVNSSSDKIRSSPSASGQDNGK